MTPVTPTKPVTEGAGPFALRLMPPMPLFVLQPILRRIVNRVARENPDMFGRLGPHITANFVVDPINLPFVLHLRPDPDNLLLRACSRRNIPDHDARVAGKFLDLARLIDSDLDGDALFFSRELSVTGNTEAVVCLRNAMDDVDGSIAQSVADMFGPPGRMALKAIRATGDPARKDGGR